nr:MAG TPA: hypothetical protein [Caudoviricetes sp.]
MCRACVRHAAKTFTRRNLHLDKTHVRPRFGLWDF